MNEEELIRCSNCGASITSEICPYCKTPTGIKQTYANMDYQLINCNEVRIGYFTFALPFALAFVFGFVSLMLLGFEDLNNIDKDVLIIVFPLITIAIISLIIIITTITKYLIIQIKGKTKYTKIYKINKNENSFNEIKELELLVTTNDGPKLILYRLDEPKRKYYNLYDTIAIKVYKDKFIVKNHKIDPVAKIKQIKQNKKEFEEIMANLYKKREYPTLECKEHKLLENNYISYYVLPIILILIGLYINLSTLENNVIYLVYLIPLILGLVALFFTIIYVRKDKSIKNNGIDLEGTVCEYIENPNIVVNGKYALIMVILIETKDNKFYINYETTDYAKPFKINSKIKLKQYKNMFSIITKK